MKSLRQVYEIKAPVAKVWRALTDAKVIDSWGGGPAKMNDKLGGFSLWGGDIHGKNTKVISEKELWQDWISGNWEVPSKVIFKLSSKGDLTIVTLIQTGIPDSQYKDIADGWKRYYLGEIKKLLENTN